VQKCSVIITLLSLSFVILPSSVVIVRHLISKMTVYMLSGIVNTTLNFIVVESFVQLSGLLLVTLAICFCGAKAAEFAK